MKMIIISIIVVIFLNDNVLVCPIKIYFGTKAPKMIEKNVF